MEYKNFKYTETTGPPIGFLVLTRGEFYLFFIYLNTTNSINFFTNIYLFFYLFFSSFNQLDLPAYETYTKLKNNLLKAIHECSEGFGFV